MRERVEALGGRLAARQRPRPGHHHRRHGPGSVTVIRILLADDHPVVRDGLRGMLASEADFEVVGEAASGAEAVRLTERERPDVVLIDLRMPEMDGATGYLLKDTPRERLFPAIRAAARGETVLAPTVVTRAGQPHASAVDDRTAAVVAALERGIIALPRRAR
jgi:DNA-binding NarL/FixJ family response regulator